MRVHCVVAEKLGFVPLFIEGPNADLRYKFVLIDEELVYGNVRHHWDLVKWLLRGPLSAKYPTSLVEARPVIETEKILTVFGGVDHDDRVEMEIYVMPDDVVAHDIRLHITTALRAHLALRASV